ncbi:MAG: dihydroorotate dehydrogenase-like protein [Calditrichaeota bacterium]|nr:dihydroorotate dehydrogenase-like protein [Calditrichota bacterium]
MKLSTSYLGLTLKHPVMSSASPLAQNLPGVKRLEDAGASAIVLPSLFEEQIEQEALSLHLAMEQGSESFGEALSYFPEPDRFLVGPDEYLNLVAQCKQSCDVPIIASLNGRAPGSWAHHAKLIEQAGADALELNIYYLATDFTITGADVENNYIEILKAVKSEVKIPVALKLSPYFSAFASMAKRCDEAGADGLVLFNRFYQPDLDIEELEVKPHVELSTSSDIRLPLRWLAILHGNLKCGLAATSGVHTHEDAIKLLMAGADVVMMCSALYQWGIHRLARLVDEIEVWMQDHGYESLEVLRGSMSQRSVADPAAFERANYMKSLQSFRALA